MISNIESFENAMNLYSKLKRNGEFQKQEDPGLFSSYIDEDVREYLTLIQKTDKVRIFKAERSLYMVPEFDNELYRYSNEDLREEMKLKNNAELFTIQFIWMIILGKFFGDQYEQTGEARSFVPIDEIRSFIQETINNFKKQRNEKLEELTDEYQLSLNDIIYTWESLGTISTETKSIERSYTKDFGFIHKGLSFWEKEKIIIVREKTEIILTEKGRLIPEYYYHQDDNIKKLFLMMEEMKYTDIEGEI